MGLDMYLYTNSKKVSQEVNDMTDEWEGKFQAPRGIAVQWRKANQVHKWFVDNVQDGNDDCGHYEVSVSDLVRLHDVCKEVLDSTELVDGERIADPSRAWELLPTKNGFFFGSTDYDQWYWLDVQYTECKLAKLLDCLEPKGDGWHVVHQDEPDWYVKFYYHSSW